MDVTGEFETLSATILASEDWAQEYHDTPTEFGQLLRQTARLERLTLQHFKDVANNMNRFVNWYQYGREVQAFDVQVIVNDDQLQAEEAGFLRIVFDTCNTITGLGAQSGEQQYQIPLGLDSTSTLIQQLTTDNLANLVGKKIDKNTGRLIPNPKASYQIGDTTRDRIAQSIKNSIRLGENHEAAAARLRKTIADPKRAELIAHTEAVRAFGSGRRTYALQSNATGHKWRDNGAVDVCRDNASQGFIPIDQAFTSGDFACPAHPRCKCNVLYTYKPAAQW